MDYCSSSSSRSNEVNNVEEKELVMVTEIHSTGKGESAEPLQPEPSTHPQPNHTEHFRHRATTGPKLHYQSAESFMYVNIFEAITRLEMRMNKLQNSVDDVTNLVRRVATAKEHRPSQVDGHRGANSILYARPHRDDEETRHRMSTAIPFHVGMKDMLATQTQTDSNSAAEAAAAIAVDSNASKTASIRSATLTQAPKSLQPFVDSKSGDVKKADPDQQQQEQQPTAKEMKEEVAATTKATVMIQKALKDNNTIRHGSQIRNQSSKALSDTVFIRRLSVGSFVVPEFEKLKKQLVEERTTRGVDISLWRQFRHMFRRLGKRPTVLPGVHDLPPLLAGRYHKAFSLTFNPDSMKRVCWDYLMLTMVIIQLIVTPLSLSFEHEFPQRMSERLDFAGIAVFALDFFLNCLTWYRTREGEVMVHPRDTIKHYLVSGWALPDFLSFFPFEYVFTSGDNSRRLLVVLKVIRLVKVSQLAKRFNSAKKAGVLRFLRLISVVFLISHCGACYWNFVAKAWKDHSEDYNTLTMGAKYARCWSLVIGCLNASPPNMNNSLEEISVALFMLIGNYVQAVVFGSVAVLISSLDEEDAAYSKKLMNTYERCQLLGIPESLTNRIQEYYRSLYRETKSISSDADSFIDELSPSLTCEVKFQLYRDMLKQIPFFSNNRLDSSVLEFLVLHLRTVSYMQEDMVIRKGEYGDWMGFIGSKGCVGVLDPNTDTRRVIRILRKGEYFGEMALLKRSKRSTTAVALTWVQIHVLCRDDLEDVRAQYPEEALVLEDEIIQYMKYKVTYK